MPEVVTPFSVLGLLREIEQRNGLSAPQLRELSTSIQQLERHYFEPGFLISLVCGEDLGRVASPSGSASRREWERGMYLRV